MGRNFNKSAYDRCIGKMVSGWAYRLNVSTRDKEIISDKYGDVIKKVQEILPKTHFLRIGTVVAKAALIYNPEKVYEFCGCLRDEIFQGKDDPAHQLWQHLIRPSGKDAAHTWEDTYKKAVTAVRAFCEGRTVTELRQSTTDIFSWERDFTVPKASIKKVDATTRLTVAAKNPRKKKEIDHWWKDDRPAIQVQKVQKNGVCECGKLAFVILPDGIAKCGECYLSSL